jgi:hypothetical protein
MMVLVEVVVYAAVVPEGYKQEQSTEFSALGVMEMETGMGMGMGMGGPKTV